jgi:hypothetical protein
MVYLIGSLRNPQVPIIANQMRYAGLDVFDDWYAAGPEADDKWRDYERGRGRSFEEALSGYAARNVFRFDRTHLERASAVVLVLPAGKSGHLELGWALGKGKPGFILLDSPDRWDVMYQFATKVVENVPALVAAIEESLGDEQHILARPQFIEVRCPDCQVGLGQRHLSWCVVGAIGRNVRTGERD